MPVWLRSAACRPQLPQQHGHTCFECCMTLPPCSACYSDQLTHQAYHSSPSLLLPSPGRLAYTERMCWCGYRRPHTSQGCCHSSPSSLPLPLSSSPLPPASPLLRSSGLAAAAAALSSSSPLCCRSHLSTASSSRQSGAPNRSSPAAPTRLPSRKHSRPVQGGQVTAAVRHLNGLAQGLPSRSHWHAAQKPLACSTLCCSMAVPLTQPCSSNHTHPAPAACAGAGAACYGG